MRVTKTPSLKRVTTVLLLLLVFTPIAFVTFFGFQLQQQESKIIKANFEELVSAQLKHVDDQLAIYFESLENQLNANLITIRTKDTARIRQLLQQSRYMQNLFISDPSEERIYPPDEDLSSSEINFLGRTNNLWLEQEVFSNQSRIEDSDTEISQTTKKSFLPKIQQEKLKTFDWSSKYKSNSKVQSRFIESSGWHIWYVNSGMSFIYWIRDDKNFLYAIELFSGRIISDLINILPNQSEVKKTLSNASIQLINEKGDLLYQWGFFNTKQQIPIHSMYLSHPLGSWKLNYFSKGLEQNQKSQAFNLIVIIIGFAFMLIVTAMYLYREHYKEINMAQKRVSFVNRVSHELKTPLTNIRMYAELMADKINPKDGLGKHIHVITTESQRLSRLIDNVLNFSRSQRERLKLNKLKCNPDEHLNAVINVVEPIMKSAGVEVCLGKITNQPVYLDPELFEQIMINLLSNAEKYAACGKKVDISAEIKDQNLIIYVQDYGPGIQQNQSLKIFEPFYRISSKLTDGVSGAGIGLSIAKELALLHGGNLELVTSNLGKGCCFKLTLNISDPNST